MAREAQAGRTTCREDEGERGREGGGVGRKGQSRQQAQLSPPSPPTNLAIRPQGHPLGRQWGSTATRQAVPTKTQPLPECSLHGRHRDRVCGAAGGGLGQHGHCKSPHDESPPPPPPPLGNIPVALGRLGTLCSKGTSTKGSTDTFALLHLIGSYPLAMHAQARHTAHSPHNATCKVYVEMQCGTDVQCLDW